MFLKVGLKKDLGKKDLADSVKIANEINYFTREV